MGDREYPDIRAKGGCYRMLGEVSIQSTIPRPDFLHEIKLKE